MDSLGIESQGRGEIFPHPCRSALGPTQSPTNGSVPVLKQPGCGVDHPSPSSAKVKERVKLYIYSASGPLCLSRVNFTFTKPFSARITHPVGAADNWNLNDSHTKKAIKCQYLNLMLSILSISLHDSYTCH